MIKQDNFQNDKNIYTICLTFKNVDENLFKDFHSIASKIQEDKIFQGKKHYEKVMIISLIDEFNDLQDKYQIGQHTQGSINKQLDNLMQANNHNVQFGQMKKKITKIQVFQKKSDNNPDKINIHMLLQYSQKKCDQNLIQKIKRMLKADSYEERQYIRSSIYKNFYRPHTDIFQYPTQNKIVLNNFSYGMQKNPSSEFIKIWDLKELKDLYEEEKEGCQGVCFVEFIHKKNFKDENQFFIFFTLKVLDYYIPFKLQVQVESIYTRNLFSNNKDDFTLFLKIAGFPKISKSLEVNNKFYYHYDFLNWERYNNFLLGKIQEQSNLIKMQILQHHVIQINASREYILENKEAFANIISYFKEQNKVQFHEQLSPKSQPQDLLYQNYFTKVIEFLEDLKNKKCKQYVSMFKKSLAKLVMSKILDLRMLNDYNIQQIINKNFQKVTLLFRLMHLNPSIYQIQNRDFKAFLDEKLKQFSDLKDLKNEINKSLWIPENFCLVNKIIITPSVVIYGNEELVPLSSSFQIKKFYEKNSIIYLLDEDLNLFDFEETSDKFFKSTFEQYIKDDSFRIEDFAGYKIDAITSRCMKRNCFFATQSENHDDLEKTFLDYIQNSNVNCTQPIYTFEIDNIEIQGQHQEIGYLNFKLLDKILTGADFDYKNMKFSSIFVNYKLNNGVNKLCTLFYHEIMQNEGYQIKFTFNQEEKNQIYEKATLQIFSINKCKNKGFINKTNLGDFLQSKDLILQKLNEPIQQDKFEGLELSLQLNEVKILQKINQLESYLCQNIYPIQDSFIITGRKAIKIKDIFETIYDQTKKELTKNFTIEQIQLKLPQHQKLEVKRVLVAKKRGTFVGKFYVFDVLQGEYNYQSNEIKIDQSIILFHTDFQEYYFWPELYSQREDVFENNQREYIVIINPNLITNEINEMEEFTKSKIKEIQNRSNDKNFQGNINWLNQSMSENEGSKQSKSKGKIETRGQQFLNGIIKNNIKSQAMLLFYGEQIQQQQQQINNQSNQQDQYQYNKESYLHELFDELNLNEPPFNLDKFKKEKKYYDFYFLLKSQLNHIVYSLNLQYKIKNKQSKQQNENLEKNNQTLNLIYELYEEIQKQLSDLKNQIKTTQNSFFQLHQFRNIFVEKELSLPQELIEKCIKNMMIFYKNLNQLSINYILQRTDVNQRNDLFNNDHKMQNSQAISSGYYLSLHELIKLYKNNLIKDISQDFVDYFNNYFKEELQQEKCMYLYNEAMNPVIYVKNKVKIQQQQQKKMKDKAIYLLNEAMYLVNFYFITKNKKLDQHDLSQFESDLKDLYELSKDSLKNQNFYYCVLPKIIELIGYNPRFSQYFVMKNIKNQIQKDIKQEEEDEEELEQEEQDDKKYKEEQQKEYFPININDISAINSLNQSDANISLMSILDLSIIQNQK
ncbi:hypothetical protein TTHERM_01043190 (macronuclear) [Tetrahymena thermophila SB210]|uniref:Uncharacterized protein n=1 Tax=Tetrahymena thermophila (strain SB210) TaxID=312017 RepID=Q22CJ0_TETTS|nr:hypothetical protein TTHERM_01043190 [Tetrahymena thermophila SB210]EAR83002.2 hypothetical protein TTHERM_01043190 [Tetrahymena thermophila SB210]|eukprot:XP_001030665.2 hypothetical protein TTHERM_01043190 [Tetrahymena thermophila SB210]